MKVEYNRFQRNQVSDEVKVSLNSNSPTLHLSKDFLEKVRVEQIVPEPGSVEASPEGIPYTFKARTPESRIIFYVKPTAVGSLNITMRSPDNQVVFSLYTLN